MIRHLWQVFKAHEQIESADIERFCRCVVYADCSAWWCGVEVESSRACDSSSLRPFNLLDFDAHDLRQVIGSADLGVGPVEYEIRCNQRAGRSDTGNVCKVGEDVECQKLVERIVLRIPLVTQPEGKGASVVAEEPLARPEKCYGGEIGQLVQTPGQETSWVSRAIGKRRPVPKARGETRRMGGAWRRLYSAWPTRRSTSTTVASSKPRATISPRVRLSIT